MVIPVVHEHNLSPTHNIVSNFKMLDIRTRPNCEVDFHL